MANRSLGAGGAVNKPSGLGYKKILNKQGDIIGYVKGKTVLHSDLTVWGTLPSKRLSDAYVFAGAGEQAAGFIDANGNFFDSRGGFLGSVRRVNKASLITLAVIVCIILVGVTSYFSSFIMGNIGIPTFNPVYPTIDVVQNDGKLSWQTAENLDILGSETGAKIIFPGAKGTYSFVVNNINKDNIIFDIDFEDVNTQKIPMRYRLKMNNYYVAGNSDTWVTIDELLKDDMVLPAESRAIYTLEWKWDANMNDLLDTQIGTKATATYTLGITVSAEITTIQ